MLERFSFTFSRLVLAVIFIWFGALKFFNVSPANSLVEALLLKTLPFIPFPTFIVILGAIEVLIGILFLVPKAEKVAIIVLCLHMLTTIMPLFLLPEMSWQGFLIPTLEGQYILKNTALVALAIGILADLE